MRHTWGWFAGGIAAILIGLAVWETVFVLVPVGLVLVVVGAMESVRRRPT